MFAHPLLLLTANGERNRRIAEILEAEVQHEYSTKASYYGDLPSQKFDVAALVNLCAMEKSMCVLVVAAFRTKLDSLNLDLPDIDFWRLKEKVKKCLSSIRRTSAGITHVFDDGDFTAKVGEHESWDEHPSFTNAASNDRARLIQWNALLLNRVSDVHRALHYWISDRERRLLIASSPDQRLPAGADEVIAELIRTVTRELNEYYRMVNGL